MQSKFFTPAQQKEIMQVQILLRSSDIPHTVNCRLSWSQVSSSIQLLVNATWLRDRRQGIVHLIVIVIDICNGTVKG
jgi:hypothetical protein